MAPPDDQLADAAASEGEAPPEEELVLLLEELRVRGMRSRNCVFGAARKDTASELHTALQETQLQLAKTEEELKASPRAPGPAHTSTHTTTKTTKTKATQTDQQANTRTSGTEAGGAHCTRASGLEEATNRSLQNAQALGEAERGNTNAAQWPKPRGHNKSRDTEKTQSYVDDLKEPFPKVRVGRLVCFLAVASVGQHISRS